MGGAAASMPVSNGIAKAGLSLQTAALRSQMTINKLLEIREDDGEGEKRLDASEEGLEPARDLPAEGQRVTEAVEASVAQVHLPKTYHMGEMLAQARREPFVVDDGTTRVEAQTLRDTEAAWKRAKGTIGPVPPRASNADRAGRFLPNAAPAKASTRGRRYSVGDPGAPACPPWNPQAGVAAGRKAKLDQHYPFSEFSRVELAEHLANADSHASYYSTESGAERDERDEREESEGSARDAGGNMNASSNNNDPEDDGDQEDAEAPHENDGPSDRAIPEEAQQQEDEDPWAGYASDEDDEALLDASDAIEATKRAAQRVQLNEVLTQVTMLECAANKYRALSGASWRPSREKFTQQILRPLFLDMMRTRAFEHVGLDPIGEIAKTRLADFLDAYMVIAAEKLEQNRARLEPSWSRAKMLADYCVLHGCSMVRGYERLQTCGWDISQKSLGNKALGMGEQHAVGTAEAMDALCAGVRALDMTRIRRAIPHCTDAQIAQTLLLAVSTSALVSRVIRLLLGYEEAAAQRKAYLLAASRDRLDALSLLSRLAPHVPREVQHEALLIAAKRGGLATVSAMLGFADEVTLRKALAIAAAVDHVEVVRRILPLLPAETWKTLWAMGGPRTKRFYGVLSTQERFRWAQYGPKSGTGSTYCSNFLHVDLLLSFLQVMHGYRFEKKVLCDLHAGAGQAVLAACLAQGFRRAVGFEVDAVLLQSAKTAVERFEADMENLFVPSFDEEDLPGTESAAGDGMETSTPEILFKQRSQAKQQPSVTRECEQAHLLLATPMACENLDVRVLREGAVLAVYRLPSGLKILHRRQALCKLQSITSPVPTEDGEDPSVLWEVFIRRARKDAGRLVGAD